VELGTGNQVAAAIIGRWNDSLSPASQGVGIAAWTTDTTTSGGLLTGYPSRHNQADTVTYQTEVGHAWDLGDVRLHVHWVPQANPGVAQSVRWRYRAQWVTMGEVTAEVTGDVDVTVGTTDGGKEKSSHLATLTPPASATASTFLIYSLTRLGTDGADTYTTGKAWGTAAANVWLLGSGIHYQAQRYGTATETA